MLARLEDDVGEDDCLVRLALEELEQRYTHRVRKVVCQALFVIERAVLHPCFLA